MLDRFNKLRTKYEKHKQNFKYCRDNKIYKLLDPISKKKYYKDKYCAQFQEDFFVDFILNGDKWTNTPLYHYILHDRLVMNRRKINKDFLQFRYKLKLDL